VVWGGVFGGCWVGVFVGVGGGGGFGGGGCLGGWGGWGGWWVVGCMGGVWFVGVGVGDKPNGFPPTAMKSGPTKKRGGAGVSWGC